MPLYSALLYSGFFLLATVFLWFIARDEYGRRIPTFLLGVLLVLFSALRYEVGRDYTVYERAFNRYYSYDAEHMEAVWNYFKSILRYFNFEFPMWTFLVALIFIFLVIRAYRQQSYNLALALFVFIFMYRLYFESFNMVRQAMAEAVCLFVIPYLRQKRYVPALFLLMGALLIHKSAFIMVALTPFLFIRYNRYFVGGVLILSLTLFPILFKATLIALIPYLPFDTFYIETMYDTQEGKGSGIGFIINTLLAFYILYRQRELTDEDAHLLPYLNTWLFVCLLSNSFSFFQVADRLMYYPLMFFPILVSNFFIRGHRMDRVVLSLFILFQIMITIKTISDPSETYHNYKIILKDKDAPSDFWVGYNMTSTPTLLEQKMA
ncbi:EpsG family protein [Porphyromonas circumdentaria]|uniref:EpsG family protein n=1 Tax=Porphyromonas circumdentaria TaxID=29524 RepID=A0A1T4PKB1_9PORP|nr:EpsG family protein [Porphyromonas circumdentaria]MBB6276413.1 hypothetical protein [Porphyromonas circumdentaria]MDO4722543.1 EpsG family protein [Porphyromonas circumdentaria]SJZ91889.1 EpsG family protein [Porphyromonas circumdentaria]